MTAKKSRKQLLVEQCKAAGIDHVGTAQVLEARLAALRAKVEPRPKFQRRQPKRIDPGHAAAAGIAIAATLAATGQL